MEESISKIGFRSRLLRLLLCIGLVAIFIFFVGPWISRTPLYEPLGSFIEDNNIDAGALFYTEVEEFSSADVYMRNLLNYTPALAGDRKD